MDFGEEGNASLQFALAFHGFFIAIIAATTLIAIIATFYSRCQISTKGPLQVIFILLFAVFLAYLCSGFLDNTATL